MSATAAAVRSPAPPAAPKEKTVSVKRGFGWTLSAYAIYMACQWAMLTILVRMGSADLRQVATFSMALATVAPVFLFANLGLRRAFATDASREFGFADYADLRFWSNVVALAAIAAIVGIFRYPADLVWATLAFGAAKAIEGTSDIFYGQFQLKGRIDLTAKAMIARGLLSLAGFAAGFAATRQVVWAIVGMAAGWLVVLLGFEWSRVRKYAVSEPRVPRRAARLAWLTLPLGVVALITAVKPSLPVFIIQNHLGETSLAVFTAVIYFHHGINRVVSALGEAAASRLASLYASGSSAALARLLGRMLIVALALSAAAVVTAVVAGDAVLRLLYGPRLVGWSGLLIVVLLAATVANLQTVFDYGLIAIRRFNIQPVLYGAGAALVLLLCLFFVPRLGLDGVALSLGIASLVELAVSAGIVARAVLGGRR